MKKLFNFYAAGSIGGLVNSLVVWLFGVVGINALLGVAIHPVLSAKWLYPRIVWGGLWGVLLLLVKDKNKFFLTSFLLSLGPSLVQLLVVFPFKANKGYFGLDLGVMTPLLVIIFNYIYALALLKLADLKE